jgi:hypothetical protein
MYIGAARILSRGIARKLLALILKPFKTNFIDHPRIFRVYEYFKKYFKFLLLIFGILPSFFLILIPPHQNPSGRCLIIPLKAPYAVRHWLTDWRACGR